ncbi:LOW QUALITY PROTEIN: hypothetical protein ACG7TL_008654 [Trametes sanguinea]
MATNTPSTTTPAYTEAWLPGSDGLQFYTRTYRPPAGTSARAALLFVHGFAEHVARYEWAHGVWAARGVAVFAYDQRGFGRTALDKERKSRESAWGRTGWREQVRDIEWWLGRVREEFPGLPLFLMGHSMGGGLALAFATRPSPPPAPESVQMLAGVIASSPLLLQTHPAPKILRYIGGKASSLLPHLLIDAPVPVEHLSHDPQAQKAAANDPLMLQKGSLRGLSDMLGGVGSFHRHVFLMYSKTSEFQGEQLLWHDYKNWPQSLPRQELSEMLVAMHTRAAWTASALEGGVLRALPGRRASLNPGHTTAEDDGGVSLYVVTSYKASEEFYNKVDAADKELKPYPDGFHELVHEPDGVKERFVDECISWVLKHAESPPPPPSASASKL